MSSKPDVAICPVKRTPIKNVPFPIQPGVMLSNNAFSPRSECGGSHTLDYPPLRVR